jgi:type I restriction enzyme S subunit
MSLPRYEKYKDSGVEWLDEVPKHWEVRRLKYKTNIFPSNVDKKSYDDGISIKLCNYTNVYYSSSIKFDMDFMSATATEQQIRKFTLKAGDTIITKDSESSDDIAISAYVPETLEGVICGYHLSIVRPKANVCGAFIKYLFDSRYAKSKFAVLANGLTRVGLGQYQLDNIDMPFPSVHEQKKIAYFLDQEITKIDDLIQESSNLIALLKEKRQALISHAVTKGLNPNVPMKDSGIEWLGEVPEHWEVGAIKRYFTFLNNRRVPLSSEERGNKNGNFPYYGASGIIDWVDEYIFDEDLILVSEDGANLLNRSTPIAFIAYGCYWVNNHAHILAPPDKNLIFWSLLIESINLGYSQK